MLHCTITVRAALRWQSLGSHRLLASERWKSRGARTKNERLGKFCASQCCNIDIDKKSRQIAWEIGFPFLITTKKSLPNWNLATVTVEQFAVLYFENFITGKEPSLSPHDARSVQGLFYRQQDYSSPGGTRWSWLSSQVPVQVSKTWDCGSQVMIHNGFLWVSSGDRNADRSGHFV